MTPRFRPARVEVDLAAVRSNIRRLVSDSAPAEVLAVVKADAYGHGAVPIASCALEAGATRLGVAIVEEGALLRDAGITAPILLLSEPPANVADAVVANALTSTVYTAGGIDALGRAARDAGEVIPVHLKVDTGMHRVGCTTQDALALAQRIAADSGLTLEGVFTHFATADEADSEFVETQLERFRTVLADLESAGINPVITHCANSAAALTRPSALFSMVRLGITIYGIAPSPELEPLNGLTQALSFTSEVTFVKRLSAGDRLSYGQRYELMSASTIATIPVGYADGVPRRLGEVGGEVLIAGKRFPIAGTITMDQLLVDVGDVDVSIGDEVVFLGKQGDQEITASEWAGRLNTIAYEIVCGIGPRVPREYRA